MATPPPPVLHALVIPFPSQSHITPLMQISRLLSSHGFRITFVISETFRVIMERPQSRPGHTLAGTDPNSEQLGDDDIHLVGIEDGFPAELVGNRDSHQLLVEYLDGMRGSVEQLIEKHRKMEDSPVTCVIADFVVTWAPDVAEKFGIPSVIFWTASVSAFALHCSVPRLLREGLLPFQGKTSALDDADDFITCIPGIIPLRPSTFPSFFQGKDTSNFHFQMMMRTIDCIHKASYVLVNSFYELEKEAVDTMMESNETPRIFPIGPLVSFSLMQGEKEKYNKIRTNLLPEQDCMEWLDTQESSSVLYIAFGSLMALSSQQVRELALGLEASGQRFLWAMRPNLVQKVEAGGLTDVLPEGFLDRTKEQGLIISWAPQQRVLSHPAVGGFLTHCGWNSTTESISMGVPMLAWPHFADQKMNARYIEDVWKVGMEFEVEEDGAVVRKEEVERVMRRVMEGGEEVRDRAGRWRMRAEEAMGEVGSSRLNIEKFVEQMMSSAKQHCNGT